MLTQLAGLPIEAMLDGVMEDVMSFGKHAPKGGALIDTKTYACDGAAGKCTRYGVCPPAKESMRDSQS